MAKTDDGHQPRPVPLSKCPSLLPCFPNDIMGSAEPILTASECGKRGRHRTDTHLSCMPFWSTSKGMKSTSTKLSWVSMRSVSRFPVAIHRIGLIKSDEMGLRWWSSSRRSMMTKSWTVCDIDSIGHRVLGAQDYYTLSITVNGRMVVFFPKNHLPPFTFHLPDKSFRLSADECVTALMGEGLRVPKPWGHVWMGWIVNIQWELSMEGIDEGAKRKRVTWNGNLHYLKWIGGLLKFQLISTCARKWRWR